MYIYILKSTMFHNSTVWKEIKMPSGFPQTTNWNYPNTIIHTDRYPKFRPMKIKTFAVLLKKWKYNRISVKLSGFQEISSLFLGLLQFTSLDKPAQDLVAGLLIIHICTYCTIEGNNCLICDLAFVHVRERETEGGAPENRTPSYCKEEPEYIL